MPSISTVFITVFTGILSRIKHSVFPLPEEEILQEEKRMKEVYGVLAHLSLLSALTLKRIYQ